MVATAAPSAYSDHDYMGPSTAPAVMAHVEKLLAWLFGAALSGSLGAVGAMCHLVWHMDAAVWPAAAILLITGGFTLASTIHGSWSAKSALAAILAVSTTVFIGGVFLASYFVR